jgi:hypothetical protein
VRLAARVTAVERKRQELSMLKALPADSMRLSTSGQFAAGHAELAIFLPRYGKHNTMLTESPPGSSTSERSTLSYVDASSYMRSGLAQKSTSDLDSLRGGPRIGLDDARVHLHAPTLKVHEHLGRLLLHVRARLEGQSHVVSVLAVDDRKLLASRRRSSAACP